MKITLVFPVLVLFILSSCNAPKVVQDYESERLKIERIAPHTFQHISYLDTETYGKVACNGMVVAVDGEAIIFDTPSYDQDAQELIQWVEEELNCQIVGVVATHFHIDCLGSLGEFHAKQIPSYANELTIELAKTEGNTLPQIGFEDALELKVGGSSVIVDFLGAGHTYDNVIAYFPTDKAMFGGCMVKSIGAGKGNVADADVAVWPLTVEKVKMVYPDAAIIVPGHGQRGGAELLDYTIELFEGG